MIPVTVLARHEPPLRIMALHAQVYFENLTITNTSGPPAAPGGQESRPGRRRHGGTASRRRATAGPGLREPRPGSPLRPGGVLLLKGTGRDHAGAEAESPGQVKGPFAWVLATANQAGQSIRKAARLGTGERGLSTNASSHGSPADVSNAGSGLTTKPRRLR